MTLAINFDPYNQLSPLQSTLTLSEPTFLIPSSTAAILLFLFSLLPPFVFSFLLLHPSSYPTHFSTLPSSQFLPHLPLLNPGIFLIFLPLPFPCLVSPPLALPLPLPLPGPFPDPFPNLLFDSPSLLIPSGTVRGASLVQASRKSTIPSYFKETSAYG